MFTFLHIDNFPKPKYTFTFIWFEIFWCICSFTQLIWYSKFQNLPYQVDILKLIYTYPTLVCILWNQNNISNYHVHSTQHMYIHNKMSTQWCYHVAIFYVWEINLSKLQTKISKWKLDILNKPKHSLNIRWMGRFLCTLSILGNCKKNILTKVSTHSWMINPNTLTIKVAN